MCFSVLQRTPIKRINELNFVYYDNNNNNALPSWKLSPNVGRIEILETLHFERRICPSARCASAGNAIGSDTDIFNTSSISINDLQVFNNFSLAKFSFNLGILLAVNLLIFCTFLPHFVDKELCCLCNWP